MRTVERVRPPRRRGSVRMRLAAWHTMTLAVLLAAFAVASYAYLRFTLMARVDRGVLDTERQFVLAWREERLENGTAPEESARDAVLDSRYRDGRVLVYDGGGALVALSDSTSLAAGLTSDALAHLDAAPFSTLAARADDRAPRLATIGDDDAKVRVAVRRWRGEGRPMTVVVLRSLQAEIEALETFGRWMLAAIPVALLLAGIGGYLLARAALAPVDAISLRARNIGADTLGERLPVRNPDDELGRLALVLNELLARREDALARQRQFMADASHELRTPVTVVRSAAELALDRTPLTIADAAEALRVVAGEGTRLTAIVEELFFLARADAAQQPVLRTSVYLEELVQDAASAVRMLASRRGITVHCAAADEAPFDGDAALLHRMLLNLGENAVRHTPAGGRITLSLESPVTDDGPAAYCLVVEDSGEGVPNQIRQTLFERFVRGDPARTRSEEASTAGAGLGLAIVRWIAEAHGGRVTLATTGPGGSRFEVWLPILRVVSQPRPA